MVSRPHPKAPTFRSARTLRASRRRLVDAYMVVDQRDFLQRNRLLAIRRLRICLSLADREYHVYYYLHRQWRIYGSSAAVTVNPLPGFPGIGRSRSLSTILRLFHLEARRRALPGLHGRKFVCGNRRLGRSSARECPDPRRAVLRLNSQPQLGRGRKFHSAVAQQRKQDYQAVAALGTAHFDHDFGNNPITPVDVLMAGFWNFNVSGVSVLQKIVRTGSIGAQGTWIIAFRTAA